MVLGTRQSLDPKVQVRREKPGSQLWNKQKPPGILNRVVTEEKIHLLSLSKHSKMTHSMSLAEVQDPNISQQRFDFPQEEQAVLAFWRDIAAFQTQLELTKDLPRYTFYDGPPFATGLPHYGHLLAGTIKVGSCARDARSV